MVLAVIRTVSAKSLVSPSRTVGPVDSGVGGILEPRINHIGSGSRRQDVVIDTTEGLDKGSGSKSTLDTSAQRNPASEKEVHEQQEGINKNVASTQTGEEGFEIKKTREKKEKTKTHKEEGFRS